MYTASIQIVNRQKSPTVAAMMNGSEGGVLSTNPTAKHSSTAGVSTAIGVISALGRWLKRSAAPSCSELRSFPVAATNKTVASINWQARRRYAMFGPPCFMLLRVHACIRCTKSKCNRSCWFAQLSKWGFFVHKRGISIRHRDDRHLTKGMMLRDDDSTGARSAFLRTFVCLRA